MLEKKYIFFGVLMAAVIVSAIILNIQQYFNQNNTDTTLAPNSNTPIVTNTYPSYAEPNSEKDLVSCRSDNDCLKVSTHPCCSCANGGGEKAINEIYETYWSKEKLKTDQVDCSQNFCATVYNCSDQKPVCINNICTIGNGNFKNTIE